MEANRSGDRSALGLEPIRHSGSARRGSDVLGNGEGDGTGDVSSSDQKLRDSSQAHSVVELPYSSDAELTLKRPTIRTSELKIPVLQSIPLPAIHSESTDAFSFLAPAVMETNTRVLQVQESVRSAHAADAATESQLGVSSSRIADSFSMSHHLGGLGVVGWKIGSAFDKGTAIVGKAGHTALSALAPLTDLVPLGEKSDLEAPKTGAVFVTFRHPLGLHLAAQALLHEKPFTFGEVIPEVDAEDVAWENLPLDNLSRLFRTAVSTAAAFVLIIFWTVPVAFVASISTIKGLGEAVPFLAGIANWPPVLVGIIQGILPSLFLAILMFLVKLVLRFLAKYEGHATISTMQKSLASRWLTFLVVNVLFVVTLSGGAIQALREIIDNPPSIFTKLATSLPTVSTFQITYILLQGTSAPAISNLRIGALIFALPWLSDFLQSTPRKIHTQRANAPEVDYGLYLPQISLIFIIGAAYFAVAPLVSVFAAFFFFVTWVLTKRDYLYVTHNKVETGGKFFVSAMMSMFVGLYIAQVTVAGLMLLKQAWGPAITLLITLGATLLTNYFVTKYWSPYFRYVPLDLLRRIPLDTDISDAPAHDRNIYVHPAVRAGPAFVWLPRDEHGVAGGLVDECARGHGLPGTTTGARVYVRQGLAKVKGDVALDVQWDRPLEELGEEAYATSGVAGGGGAGAGLEAGRSKSLEIPDAGATSVLRGTAGTPGDATLVGDPGVGSNGQMAQERTRQRSQE
ncbi:DUF221-domain-containing protein [Gonapodya prolifera JEL478]|uniref:DUF221-domain-containing protein n=1 Tax=Gonapodya prolifera (strain JEL478) TaxID=1344416 RepID=A0A139ALD2_GONPJ|nr:DUF221-domain-containing protein [Gonapodya prolifera JEL478]|eukprot:KXS17354.1 DUF221-domain-containing protein [Gonapodya prolifera JEL478]